MVVQSLQSCVWSRKRQCHTVIKDANISGKGWERLWSRQGGAIPNYPIGASTAVAPGVVATPTPLQIGESVYLFGVLAPGATQLPVNPSNVVGETPVTPQASIALNIDTREGSPAPAVSFEGIFSGAPGAFEIDFQEADTDIDGNYILPAAAAYKVTAVGANNGFRVDLVPTGGRFMRALLASRTNAVSLILKATRLA